MTKSEHRKLIFSLTFASVVAEFSLMIMPFIVGAMIDAYGASLQAAGRIVSLQLVGMALGGIGVSMWMARLNKLTAVYAMTVLIALANVLCALGTSLPVLIVARFACGVGEGALMATAGAIAAATSNPRGAFSFVGLGVALIASAALVVTPAIVHAFGRISTFWSLALIVAASLPFVRWLKPLSLPMVSESAQPSARSGQFTLNSVFALFAFGLFWAGGAGLWVYAERIGLSDQLNLSQIGLYLGLGQLGGIPGPLFVGWLARRWRLSPMFCAAIFVHVLAAIAFVFVHIGWVYCLMAAILSFCSAFLNPCFRTLLALLDRGGKVVAASVAFYTLGFGLSPLIITFFLAENSSFVPIAIITTALYFLSMGLVLRPAIAIGRADVAGT